MQIDQAKVHLDHEIRVPAIQLKRAHVTDIGTDHLAVDRDAVIAELKAQGYIVARPMPENAARSA